MGTYNNLLTTKTIRVNSEGGRESINLIRSMGKDVMFRNAPAWEQALLSRMEYLWSTRDYPKYTTHEGAEDGWPVYERIEQSYFTDHYPSTRILAGFLRRGEGKMLTFEKWAHLKVLVSPLSATVDTLSEQRQITDMLTESGIMHAGQWQVGKFNDFGRGVSETYVLVYAKNSDDLTLAKMVLAGHFEVVS